MTTVLNAYSTAYPLITNRLQASVFLQSDPQALIASQIDSVSGHPQRIWSFPGLPRNNYGFSLDEINGSGTIIRNLAHFDVVPGEVEGLLYRSHEQPQVGVTTGFNAGATSVTFDGTAGAPDYRGWNITPSELTGRGILVRGLDYSWDSTTGILALLQAGDQFSNNTYFDIEFDTIQSAMGNSYPTINDFICELVTTDKSFLSSDFGNKFIVEPAGLFITATLPDISTVVVGRRLMLEMSDGAGAVRNMKVIPNGSDTINFLNGNLYLLSNECCSIYKFRRSPGVFEWRVDQCDGNFKTVGQLISHDQIQAGVFNAYPLDGSMIAVNQYQRLYNEYVLQLPAQQIVDFDLWSSGNNFAFYSKANSTNPAFAGKFHVPDRRGLFERNFSSSLGTVWAGFYTGDTLKNHQHEGTFGYLTTTLFGRGITPRVVGDYGNIGSRFTDLTGPPVNADGTLQNTGTETKPKNYLTNKYVLI